ncbi:Zinc finger protein 407-like 1 [Homarus americanus]|uniref:Zinc finger protein 407-like 1 n=1 Tax=Homarus americanus TaxID=6706 RepID=A0A8J5TLK9_HOMAM|nr:Zinc finger protein 407-like 1 [Homarus americanus]
MEEVEDAHMCLRCRATIVGLNNYVSHRQAGCVASTTSQKRKQLEQEPPTEDEGRDDYRKEDDSQKTDSTRETAVRYSSSKNPFPHDDSKITSHEGTHETLAHHGEYLDGSKYDSSTSVTLRDCYVEQPTQTTEDPPVTRAEVGHLHDSYTVMEEFTTSMSQQHTEPQMRNSHSSLKSKPQESLSLNHRPNTSQAPFTGYGDPLLPHSQESANMTLFRHFDSFSDHNKIQHEGESETHSEAIALFKVASTSYELESQNFESRYSDFYSLQPAPQEPLLTTVPTLEQCKAKQETQTVHKIEDNVEIENTKEKELDREKRRDQEIRGSDSEFREGDLKYSETHMSPDNEHTAQEKSELRQDDFLSSLELRSKAPAKRRHEDDEEEFDEDDDDETGPPHHHTGGKWRPGSRPPPSVGGKWRPATPKNELEEDEEMEEDDAEEDEDSLMPPPPTYTKGKWLPGKKMTNIIKVGSSVEYHCHACNRTLKGKETYERHLNSELHFVNENKASGRKATKICKEVTPTLVSGRPVRSTKLKAQNFLKSTIAQLKSRKIVSVDDKKTNQTLKRATGNTYKNANETLTESKLLYAQKEVKQEPNVDEEEEEVKKVSLCTPKLLCPICKLSFGEAYAALHFASLAHIHNELEYRQSRCEEIDSNFNQILLQNFSAIVKTSPFHCSGCKFYCNLQEDFLVHMKTHVDDPEDDEVKTLFSCSACTDEEEMRLSGILRHLQTPHHLDNARDTVLQARQVVLSSRTGVVCPLGDGTFRYMREYRTHRRVHHQEPGFQLNDHRLLRCPQCSFKALRERQIRTHIRETHDTSSGKSHSYHCFVCGLAFSTHRQAELHRRSAEHRTTLGRQRGLSVVRTCSLCYVEVEDLPALRRHMCQEHQKDCTPCHLCGVVPPLRSDLAQHQRVCRGVPGDLMGDHKCDLCTFKNDLLAHVLTHKTLAHGQRGPDGRHACHICKTNLRLSSVKGHMLNHSNEWPHPCHLCSRKFPQQVWLERHLSVVHTHGGSSHGPALCDTCGKTLSNRWHLHRHQVEAHTHSAPAAPSDQQDLEASDPRQELESSSSERGRRNKRTMVPHPPSPSPVLCDVCGVQCESPSMLKMHRQGHKRSAGDKYDCPHCNYSTAHLPHLRRHLRLHTGSTPFSCPYCAYVCNNQENLRKHMLKTKCHPGRFMYECRLCDPLQHPPPAGDHGIPASHSLNLTASSSRSLDPGTSSASQPLETGNSKLMEFGVSKSLGIEETQPLGQEVPLSFGTTSHNLERHIFKSNYATEFQAHLLEKHRSSFQTKEDIKRSLDIGEYVADNKGPHDSEGRPGNTGEEAGMMGRRGDELQGEVERVTASSNFPLDAGARGVPEHQFPTGPGSRGPRSYLRTAGRPSIFRPGHAQSNTAHPLRIVIQHIPEANPGEGEDDGTRQVILILPDKVGEQPGDVAALLPSLGLTTSPADCVSIAAVQSKHLQHLQHPGDQLQDTSQDQHIVVGHSHSQPQSTKDPPDGAVIVQTDQVITLDTQVVADATIISGESGVASQHQNPMMLCSQAHHRQQHHHHHHHQQQILHTAHVFNPLQVVAEAAEVLTQGEGLTPHTHEVLAQTPVSREALTQTTVNHEVLNQPPVSEEVMSHPQITQEVLTQTQVTQEVLTHPPVTQNILTRPSSTQESHILEAAIFEDARGSQAQEASSILQQEATQLNFVNEQEVPSGDQSKRQGEEEGAGEIIYSFTLQ